MPGIVANQPREKNRRRWFRQRHQFETILNNSFGMLGINSVVIIKKV